MSTNSASFTPTALPLVSSTDASGRIRLEDDGTVIERSVLPGGIRLITQHVPAVRSVALGAWITVGSRDESSNAYGSTHYLEHLLFKGTRTRSALDIANAFDAVGGDSNAVTAKEYTVYHARVLEPDLPSALEIITDMITAPALREKDFQMEQTVILEELAAAADDPADVAHEVWTNTVFGSNPLGRPVGGTPKSVRATSLEHVREHYQRFYRPENLVIAAAGAVNHEQLSVALTQLLEAAGWELTATAIPASRNHNDCPQPPSVAKNAVVTRPIEQAHILMGCQSLPLNSPQRPVMSVLLTILGGGMSSRLFQEIREQRGLAYSTYAFDAAYTDHGAFAMYAACAPSSIADVQALMRGELEKLAADGVPQVELERCLNQLRGSVALGLEDGLSRMFRIGRAEVLNGQIYTVAQMLDRIAAVTSQDVAGLAEQLLQAPQFITTVGPF